MFNKNLIQEIIGIIQKIESDKFIISLSAVKEFEDGTTIIMNDGKNAQRVEIELTNETKYIRRISTGEVTTTDKAGLYENLEKKQSVIITGGQGADVFIADSVIMYELRKVN